MSQPIGDYHWMQVATKQFEQQSNIENLIPDLAPDDEAEDDGEF